MKTTQLELSEKELLEIINQIADEKDREIVKEEDGEENTIDIDHYYIKFIDPVYLVDPLKSYESDENEWTTPLKLTVTGCMCFDEYGDMVEISKYASGAITTALDVCFYINDEVKTLEK
jgi:hypothetical protein